MKKLFFTICSFVIAAITQAQTVGDSLATLAVDTNLVVKCVHKTDTCWHWEAPRVKPSEIHRGCTDNFYYYKSCEDSLLNHINTKNEAIARIIQLVAAAPCNEKPKPIEILE